MEGKNNEKSDMQPFHARPHKVLRLIGLSLHWQKTSPVIQMGVVVVVSYWLSSHAILFDTDTKVIWALLCCMCTLIKADLDGTTLTYDCRMRLAHVIHTTRIASCKSTSQFPQGCRIQLEKSCRILKHVSKPCDRHASHELSKFHATVASQSCVL